MKTKRHKFAAGIAAVALALVAVPAVSASAYSPTSQQVYQLSSSTPCLKGRGNCVIYPKSAQLNDGRIVAGWEEAAAVTYSDGSTGAVGETLPVYKSDDNGGTWQKLADVKAPAFMSNDPAVAKYTSNWTNPFFYVLPQRVGNLAAGTLLLATVVSGEDEWYREHKAADANYVPDNDGDRRDVSIALYASTDRGSSWSFLNIVAEGGWQGGSAGAPGRFSNANTAKEMDPLWEPYLMVRDDKLVAYYSDENDYTGYDASTGAPIPAPDNATGPDSGAQIIAHKTWDGATSGWSQPVVDVAGTTFAFNGGQQIGGGRPGMINVVPTTDGKWFATYEYWGGGASVRFKLADDPLKFYADGDPSGKEISRGDGVQDALPFASGSRGLSWGGSPVTIALPDGRLVYNASGSGDVWVNDGSSTGVWTQFQTTMPPGYSRNLQYNRSTGQVLILANGGPSQVLHGDADLGNSKGAYYSIQNKATGQVVGTTNNVTSANFGNGDRPDVRLETAGSASNAATQAWHLQEKPSGGITLLNKSGGRAAALWAGGASAGRAIGQWVDDSAAGQWTVVDAGNGYVRFQSTQNTSLYLTGAAAGASLTLQASMSDGSQEWKLTDLDAPVVVAPTVDPTVTTAAAGSAGWSRGTASVALALGQGAGSIQYRLDAGEWKDYVSPVSVAADGAHVVDYRATTNGAPVASSVGSVPVNVDGTAPATVVAVTPAAGTATVGQTATAAFTASDVTSGVARTEYSVNGGAWQTGTSLGVTAKGTYVAQYRSVDVAGNVEQAQTVTLTVADPNVTAAVRITSATAPSADGWYQQNVLVALTAPASGQKVQYSVNGGAWKSYSSSITVSGNGITKIDHRVLASNVVVAGSAAQTIVKIDKVAPTATVSRTPASGSGTPLNPIALSFAASDANSGVATIEYRLNDGPWASAADGVVLGTAGDHIVYYRATDRAGNVSSTKSTSVKITPNVTSTVKVSAASVVAGKEITISIAGFPRWSDVTIAIGSTTVGTVLTDQNGAAKVTVRTPLDLAKGKSTVSATNAPAGISAGVALTVK